MAWETILDVNFNRLTESLKFIEDYARFEIADQLILLKIRKLREDFTQLKKIFPLVNLIAHRQSRIDPGREPGFDSVPRNDVKDLVLANLSRAKESSRTIEEILRLKHGKLGKKMKELRFQIYDVEKLLLQKMERKFDPRLCVIIDEKYLCKSDLEKVINIFEDYGVTMTQLRVKNMSDREFYYYAAKIRRLIHSSSLKFIINDRVDIALAVNADGLHLGQEDMPLSTIRETFGNKLIIGISAHTLKQALTAQKAGADYLGVGAVFPTSTKCDATLCGLDLIRHISKSTRIPVVGIGGINDKNYRKVIKAGASGIAVASYVFEGDIERNLRKLVF